MISNKMVDGWEEEAKARLRDLAEEVERIANHKDGDIGTVGVAMFWWEYFFGHLVDWVDDPLATYERESEVDRQERMSGTAYCWDDEASPGRIEGFRSLLGQVEAAIFGLHKAAAELLMRECELRGIASTYIDISERYARLLLTREKRHDIKMYRMWVWPDCLRTVVLKLPSDIRMSIMKGNAAVNRLNIMWGETEQENQEDQPNDGQAIESERLCEAEANILEALATRGRMKLVPLAMAAEGAPEARSWFKATCSGLVKRGLINNGGRGCASKGYEITDRGKAVLAKHKGSDRWEDNSKTN